MTAPTDQAPASIPARSRVYHWLLLAGVTALAIVVDQLSKAYVVAHLTLHESWMPLDFVEPVFRFTHVRNTGAAFGMFPDRGAVFVVIALVVSGMILYYYRQLDGHVWLIRLALGLQLGGALSNNLLDRLRQGYVVDFFNVGFWPVFNVADSCIVIGVGLLAFEMLREEWRSKRDSSSDAADDPASDNALESSEETPC